MKLLSFELVLIEDDSLFRFFLFLRLLYSSSLLSSLLSLLKSLQLLIFFNFRLEFELFSISLIVFWKFSILSFCPLLS